MHEEISDANVIEGENERKESNNNNNKGKRKIEDNNKSDDDSDTDNLQIVEQQQKGVDSFLGSIIIHQLLQASNLFFLLDKRDILSLTLTSKTFFKPLSSLISQHFTFYPKSTPLIHYHPKKLEIGTFEMDGLFDNPDLSNVTEIEYKKSPLMRDISEITQHPFDKAITILLSLNLTHLTIGFNFNQPINSLFHLTKLTHLEFKYGSGFNHPVDHLLPPNLRKLCFGVLFDFPVNHLPNNLTHLEFIGNFNHPINQLPPTLIYLTLGQYFKQPINLLYLTKLTHLYFRSNSKFNHPIDNLLPPNLTNLSMGFEYNQPVNHLPHNLTNLKFHNRYNHPVDHLPYSLRKLTFGLKFEQSITKLPPNITHLNIPIYTSLQYEHIQQMPNILYFNNDLIKRNSDERGSNLASGSAT